MLKNLQINELTIIAIAIVVMVMGAIDFKWFIPFIAAILPIAVFAAERYASLSNETVYTQDYRLRRVRELVVAQILPLLLVMCAAHGLGALFSFLLGQV